MSYEINLIEGERGKLHVTSDDARTKNALMFGTGRKVFNMDHAFEATMPDSNTVRVTSGVFYDNGMFIRIDRDRYVEVPVDNGLPGTYRNDLVCIRYERNIQTQLESAGIVVKKGEASETKAVDPAYSVGDVLDLEVHLDEFPLYRVALDGITPKLEPMFAVEDVMSNISLYEEIISHIQDFDNPHQITSVNHAVTADKLSKAVKINGVAFDGTEDVVFPKVESDAALSITSTNAVQNKVITAALDGKMPVYSHNGGTFDADDFISPAIHLINSGGTNLPASCSGGVLLVDGSSQTTQYFFPLYNGDNRIHTRYKYHGTKWTDWEILGLSTSQSTVITTAGKYALDAVQNNASVSGTLANKISPLTSAIILAAGFNKESGQLFKINRTVTLNGRYSSTTNFTQSDFTTIGTLPSGFRPTTSIYGPATVCNTNTVYPAIVRILTTGKVQVYTNNLGQYSELCVTFIV